MTYRIFLRNILNADNFFFVLADKLDKIFPNGWIYDPSDFEEDIVSACNSTVGWGNAMKETFEEFDLMDCWDYYNDLGWEESDEVDFNIGQMLCATVFDEDGNRIWVEF